MKKALLVAAASTAALVASQNAYAQGCVLIREAAPVIGSISSTYIRPGEWQLDVSFRDSTADRHYSLDVEQVQWRNIAVSLAYRVEGVPRYDLVGRSHGFRRPVQEMYL